MKNFWFKIKEEWLSYLVAFGIVMVISTISFLLYYLLVGPKNLYGATNALLIPFAICLAILGFYLLNRFGMFDMFSYGCSYLVGMFRIHPKKKYKDLVEYRDIHEAKRHKYSYYVPFGLAFLLWTIALVVVYILYKTNMPH